MTDTDFLATMYGSSDETDLTPPKRDETVLEDDGLTARIVVKGRTIVVPTLRYMRRLENLIQQQERLIGRLTTALRGQKKITSRHADEINTTKRDLESKLDRRDT